MSDQRCMDLSAFLLVLFLSSAFVCCNGVEGSIELSAREDLELDNQLKLVNKPAVKAIQTEYGDKYDCVDFYDQPAFDHPMLKNHSFYFEYAVVRTRAGAGKFNGAGATLSLHRPRVSRGQYSAGRFKIQNAVEAIQVGWRVDPDLYGGDTRTRAFIRVDAGQSHCFNTRCPGFVLVRSDVPLDFVYEQTSKYGGPAYGTQLYVQRSIFSDLANPASYVEWGGMVYSPPGTPTSEMGSGHFLKQDTKYDAYFRNIQVFNNLGRNVDEFNTETFNDIGVYDVVDKKNAQNFGHLVLYGGPSL
ncbi:hypothetical protein RHGRI_005779 [Rhododendron griersonianum]|uniref:Neprosin PEP catalytic domain-containing protein n=1 Tax=Rhododendron griersonianum TaxID=479676 RepID=A0AAV6LDU0_9ERIC|nr:hypothetical protein RHGRI_005779 [Rhododendron griersonianum]